MSLRFHWSLSQVGDKFRRAAPTTAMPGHLSLDAQLAFCRQAEASGIESVLMATGFTRPDPIVLSTALGVATTRIKFMVACRSGLFSPTSFVQQINSVAALTGGRVCVNFVAGHSPHELRYYGDNLAHDERYARSDEFLSICRAFWRRDEEVNFRGNYFQIEGGRLNTQFVAPERTGPEIYLGGNSELAAQLAIKHAHCLWRFADAPENLRPHIRPVLERGVEVGLFVSLLVRPTRQEALRDARAMIASLSQQPAKFGRDFALKTDSVAFRSTLALAEENESEWLTPTLWTGAIPYLGSPAIALVGGAEEIAAALLEYKAAGVSQFLFSGWPDLEEMAYFGREVLPLIRQAEKSGSADVPSAD